MHKEKLTATRVPSPALCHLPGTFFKDLQTNFPEIFQATSGIHPSYFTSPFFTKNHPDHELPQHTPATALTSLPKNFFRLLSPSLLKDLHASRAPAGRITPAIYRMHACIAVAQSFDFLTFWRFDISTLKTTQTAYHRNPCPPQVLPQSPIALCHYMSPTILLDLRATSAFVLTLDPLAPGPLGPFFSPIVTLDSSPSITPKSQIGGANVHR